MEKTLNQYIVTRHEGLDYDEYNSVVINAESEEKAREIAINFQSYFAEKDVTVTKVSLQKEGIVHESFCAG